MLEELDIRNLGPIREATIAPAAGMTAITGETGAGKSMLLSAIRLVSGGAAESSRVSAGADEAWAQAIFALSDDAVASEHSGDTNDAGSGDADSGFTGAAAAVAKAHDAGVDPEDGELFLSRTVRASGRSRAVLGGKSVPRSVPGGHRRRTGYHSWPDRSAENRGLLTATRVSGPGGRRRSRTGRLPQGVGCAGRHG